MALAILQGLISAITQNLPAYKRVSSKKTTQHY
ncbi:Uncharacterised protein [Oligella urethralis]|nr:Uncharacterised protein [Oligella urethralis]SUA68057.1 Uncharacterised protein [Oligella urethralis]